MYTQTSEKIKTNIALTQEQTALQQHLNTFELHIKNKLNDIMIQNLQIYANKR